MSVNDARREVVTALTEKGALLRTEALPRQPEYYRLHRASLAAWAPWEKRGMTEKGPPGKIVGPSRIVVFRDMAQKSEGF